MTINIPKLPIPKELQYSPEKLPGLLLQLAEVPIITAACKACDIHPAALEIARMQDNELDSQITWALRTGINLVEERIAERALGEKKPVLDASGRQKMIIGPDGQSIPQFETDQSDKMLKDWAKRLRPDLYGDQLNISQDIKTTVYLPAAVLEDDFENMLEAQRKKTAKILVDKKRELGIEVTEADFEELSDAEDDQALDDLA